jgi:asparagine synthase (glutamine-hydrolysing)
MSVQAGIWNFDGEQVDRVLLKNISNQTAEYGPDDEAILAEGNVAILYRPFHTTAESRVEHQPYVNARGQTITWDGRLDNRDEMLSQLGDPLTASSADVEIVAAAYCRLGAECFAKFIGDWALSVWDPSNNELTLARDYIGIRHLYYHLRPTQIVWCNHLLPLVSLGGPFSLCGEYIVGYLVFHPEADLTPYRELHAVPPGAFVRLRPSGCSVHRFWKFNPQSRIIYRNDLEYEEHFRYLFRQAVLRRLRSDSPILAELSGGLDSSSIVCMADDIVASPETECPCVHTFSYWDREEPDEEDFRYLARVEEQRGRAGYHAELCSAGETLPISEFHFTATPGFDGRQEVKVVLEEQAQKGYRVLLSGRGGDEVNGQALDFRVQIADSLAQLQIRGAIRQLNTWSLRARYPLTHLLGQSINLLFPDWLRIGKIRQLEQAAPWIDREFARCHEAASLLLTAAEGHWRWLPSTRDSFQTVTTLAREMTGLRPLAFEKRYPYLDQTLLEFLMSIPTEQVLRPGDRRSLMRRALRGLLPEEIASRKSKSGTGRCVALTLDKQWHIIEPLLTSPFCSRLGFVDPQAFRDALIAAKHGRLPQVVRLLRVLALELWLREAAKRSVILVPPSIVSEQSWIRLAFKQHEPRVETSHKFPALCSHSTSNVNLMGKTFEPHK